MFFLRQLGVVLLMLSAVDAGRAGPAVLSPQVIILPSAASQPSFVDIEGKGRCDLFVIDHVAKQLLLYRQGPNGFASSPDQLIPLPAQTAWVALCDVDPHPGLELLMSTATGLVYFRQDAGRFESEAHTLIAASQVFTNCEFPNLVSLSTNKTDTNLSIPVIYAGQTVLYHRNQAYVWSPAPPVSLESKRTIWSANHDPSWAMGQNASHTLRVQRIFQSEKKPPDQNLENDAIEKLMDDLRKTEGAWPPETNAVDVDGDGREDLVLWQTSGNPYFKTDLYIFLRGADGQLPSRPTQRLRYFGLPLPIGSRDEAVPLHDLKGDGQKELVLLEFKTSALSADGLIQTVLAHGLDWKLTIRPVQHGTFSRSAEASVPLTMTLPAEILKGWPIFIQGDVNGDGRPDLFVRRSDTQWNIFFSTTDGSWFAPQPALTFNTPADGNLAVKDLRGDGLSDIIWSEPDQHRLSIYMSPSRETKGNHP